MLKLIPGYDCWRDADGFHFDDAKANAACDFCECLQLIEGEHAGKPFRMEPWQLAITGCLFGWVDLQGYRRYREALVYVPRKNGKSTLIGALLDMVLLCDGESGAQCYCAAADRDQAAVVFRHARGMIERNPELSGVVSIYNSTRTINFGDSFARVISADAASKHGYNGHFIIVDELHTQPNRELVDVLNTSTSARRQPLTVYITTADFDRPSICNEKYDAACKVRDGVTSDPRFLPVIYEAGKDDAWDDEAVWHKANPNLGVSKALDYMRRECSKAKAEPSYEATFRRLELNQKTRTREVWLRSDSWDACGEETIDLSTLAKVPCWGGLDLSSTTDITAFVLCWLLDGGRYFFLPTFWIPEAKAREKELKDKVPYAAWERAGLVRFTPGDVVDYEYIRAAIVEACDSWHVQDIAYDPWNAQGLVNNLIADGVKMIEFRQGYKTMSSPSKELEKLATARMLRHNANPVLRWMALNAVILRDPAGNIKPDKSKATEKIDGIVAAIMALGRAQANPAKPSAYAQRGILTI